MTADPTGRQAPNFNLSRWAIEHGSFTAFLLVLLVAAGAFALLRIGQKEDPDFTFRVMVVQVLWPGATTEEMRVLDRGLREPLPVHPRRQRFERQKALPVGVAARNYGFWKILGHAAMLAQPPLRSTCRRGMMA